MSIHEGFFKLFDTNFTNEVVSLPGHFEKLSNAMLGFQKSTYWLLGGAPGSGKTSFTDQMFVLDLFDWWLDNYDCSEDEFKINWIYNSMERNRSLKIAKWTAMKLFKDTGDMISTGTMVGATKYIKDEKLIKENKLLHDHKDRIRSYDDYFKKLEKYLMLYDGVINPTGLYMRFVNFAKQHGKLVKRGEYGEDYVSNHPNHFVFGVNDHVGKIRSEMHMNDKETLDKHSEYMGVLRDKYLYIPIDIYQFNRALSDSARKTNKDMFPRVEDFKGTGDGVENADAVLALFNPFKYNLDEFNGYDIQSFIGPGNENRFRSISILKNTYGIDDSDVAFGFMGEVGKFYELPSAERLIVPKEKSKIDRLLKLK